MVGLPNNAGEQALYACQRELLGLFETLIDVIFCAKDLDGVYLEVNSAFVRRTGRRSKRDVIGTTAAEHFRPELAERYADQDRQVIAEGAPLHDQLELIRRPDGRLGWYLTTKIPVRGETDAVVGLVSVSRDLVLPSSPDDEWSRSVQRVVEHCRTHLDSALTLDELARVAGCSRSQLGRRVKRVLGVSPTQHVLRVRVEAATRMLAESDMPIVDVAGRCGFYDQSDFTKRFARLTNRTPAQFRTDARASAARGIIDAGPFS